MSTIFFKRSGGFVGPRMRYQIDLDQPIEQAEFFNLPENLIVRFNPDVHQIAIRHGANRPTVRANDSTLPDSLHPWVDELSERKRVAG